MKCFRSDVQRRILAINGNIDDLHRVINGDEVRELDISIMKLAAEGISSPGQFTAFQLAYICKPSWEEIAELYAKHFPHREGGLDLDSIRRYARDAKKRLFDNASLPKVS